MSNLKGMFYVSKVKNPCTPDCSERSGTCHGECERYAKYAKALKEENENRKEAKQKVNLANKYEAGRANKIRKKKENSKRK